jgi:hypothetical protein
MSEFYAYDNHHRDRARVHRGECPYCNHGQGTHGGSSGANDQWHGPFDSADDAYARVSNRADVGYCAFCHPQDQEAPIMLGTAPLVSTLWSAEATGMLVRWPHTFTGC